MGLYPTANEGWPAVVPESIALPVAVMDGAGLETAYAHSVCRLCPPLPAQPLGNPAPSPAHRAKPRRRRGWAEQGRGAYAAGGAESHSRGPPTRPLRKRAWISRAAPFFAPSHSLGLSFEGALALRGGLSHARCALSARSAHCPDGKGNPEVGPGRPFRIVTLGSRFTLPSPTCPTPRPTPRPAPSRRALAALLRRARMGGEGARVLQASLWSDSSRHEGSTRR